MGIETEYGVLSPGRPLANPMLMSSQVVTTYRALVAREAARRGGRPPARWDYDDEDPLQDARGFHLQRAAAHPSLLTDDPAHAAPAGPSSAATAASPADGTPAGPASARVATPGGQRRARTRAQSLEEIERPASDEYD